MKEVRQSKSAVVPAKQEEQDQNRVQVIQGNVPLLTIQLLAQINKNLVEIKNALEKKNG